MNILAQPEDFIESLQRHFNENNPDGNRLHLNWKRGKGENYSIEYAAGNIFLKGESIAAVIFGMSLIKTAAFSGHLAEYLGKHSSKLGTRALWIKELDDKIKPLSKEKTAFLCQKILLLGYNTLIFEFPIEELEECLTHLEKFIPTIDNYGLKIAIKIYHSPIAQPYPFNKEYKDYLKQSLQPIINHSSWIDYLFWEAHIYNYEAEKTLKGRNFLYQDLAKIEAQTLETLLPSPCRLIYSIPTKDILSAEKQSRWILAFSYELSEKTLIAFSSLAGDPCFDYLPPHPLWEVLRREKNKSHANFLPLLNTGLVGQGEGFWPIFSLDLNNRYLLRCDSTLFAGAISITAYLPKEESLLSCSLWTAAYTMLGEGQNSPLAETWFGAYCPDILKYKDHDRILGEMRQISIMIGYLSTYPRDDKANASREEYRILSESLLSRLRVLQASIDNQQTENSKHLKLKDYFTFFLRDGRRLILRFLQQHQITMVNGLTDDDSQESFWTTTSTAGSHGWNAGTKVFIREEPSKGEAGSIMEKIYEEVVLFSSSAKIESPL